jgi:peptide/nickel transport system permease protein
MATRKAKLAFNLKRFKGFLFSLWRSKRGLFGVVILVIAIIVSMAAPLLTPYHPINTRGLAGSYAAPSWLKYFPGGEGLTENFFPINDSQFDNPNALKEFNVTVTPSFPNVFAQYSSEVGLPASPGSLEIVYENSSAPVNSSVTVFVSKNFYYPYSGVPGTFTFTAAILLPRIDGVSVKANIVLRQNWLIGVSPSVFTYSLTRFDFGGSQTKGLYPENYVATNRTQARRTLDWIYPPAYALQSVGSGVTTLRQLFPRAGNYTFGIEITITKLAKNAEAAIYLDGLNMQLFGTAWGLFGTDSYGRDVYTQLIYGTRISLIIGLLASILSVGIGLIVGLVSAYMGGVVDEVLMRFTDALLVLPGLPLMIVLMTVLSQAQYNMGTLIIVIGFFGWMGFARVVRSQVLSLKERPYVEAAKAVGAGTPYILARHILPNVITLVYVTLALTVPSAIVTEAALSFLGFKDLSTISWGRMLSDVAQRAELWWLIIPPGLAIAILSLSFILLGYAMDEILNPKLRMRR